MVPPHFTTIEDLGTNVPMFNGISPLPDYPTVPEERAGNHLDPHLIRTLGTFVGSYDQGFREQRGAPSGRPPSCPGWKGEVRRDGETGGGPF